MAAIPSPESVLGGYYVAILLTILLYGISIAQAYVYWLNSARDKSYLRIIVAIVMFIETIHTVFAIHMSYHYIIISFGNLAAVEEIIWSSGVCVCSGMLVIMFVQIFYVRRIWILSKRNITLVVITSTVLVLRLGFGYATGALTYHLQTWPRFRHDGGPLATVSSGIALSTTMDLLIATILIYYLARSRTGFEETDHIIQRLMAYAVNTGALTMICQLAVVFVFVFQADSLFFTGLWLMTSKLYANSLLGTLNAREIFRKRKEESGHSELQIYPSQAQSRPQAIEIFQETSKVTDMEIQASYGKSQDSDLSKHHGLAP